MSDVNIIVTALVAEFQRVRSKAGGAAKRLQYARTQVVLESTLLEEATDQMNMLADAILSNGGDIPPEPDHLPGGHATS